MIGLIVTGHGHFATGLTSALQLLGGDPDNYVAVDFPDGDSTEDLSANISVALDSLSGCDGVLICCDLLGGSPFKAAVTLSVARENVRVIAGCNLPLLLETHLTRGSYESVDVLADAAIASGRASLVKFVLDFADENKDEFEEDGI